ncbi:TrkH family potassium uptake protein, partial [Pelagibacteraceae bacterium]|nr:TrkH family potassium uptake protein [Pelagibacteraceae bacterium]
LSFLISLFNIFFIYNLFSRIEFIKKEHSEDIGLAIVILISSIILLTTTNNLDLSEVLIAVISSISNSGIALDEIESNFSLYLLFLTIIGGSLVSNTSGIKLLRIYILLKASSNEILKLVRPNNVTNQYIFFSDKKINNENIKLSFLIFISFFLSIFILSGILLVDDINFENSFKLSILTLTNTVNSNNYIDQYIDFGNLLTSSKISLIIFMVIGKIELISFFLIMKKMFFKN